RGRRPRAFRPGPSHARRPWRGVRARVPRARKRPGGSRSSDDLVTIAYPVTPALAVITDAMPTISTQPASAMHRRAAPSGPHVLPTPGRPEPPIGEGHMKRIVLVAAAACRERGE